MEKKSIVAVTEGTDGFCGPIINRTEQFAFTCKACGGCCRGKTLEDVYFEPSDMYRIAKYLGMQVHQCIQEYMTVYYTSPTSQLPVFGVREVDGGCPFKGKDGKCTIHPVRPDICRLYPLSRTRIFVDASTQYAEEIFCVEQLPCQDDVTTPDVHRVSDWIEGITPDHISARWIQFLALASECLQKLYEKKEQMENDPSIQPNASDIYGPDGIQAFITLAYIGYDMAKPFEEQFINKVEILTELMESVINIERPDGTEAFCIALAKAELRLWEFTED